MRKIIVCLLLMTVLLVPLASAQLEFTPDERNEKLSTLSRIDMFLSGIAFTTAGQERNCQDFPYESKIIKERTEVCSFGDLVNVYEAPEGKSWRYINEVEAPHTISASSENIMAYECYRCPQLPTECTGGEKRCITEDKYQYCRNGNWVDAFCSIGTACGNGVCSKDNVGAICGDGYCSPGEEQRCSLDCGGNYKSDDCGDGICASSEVNSCDADCGENPQGCISSQRVEWKELPDFANPGETTRLVATVVNPTSDTCIFNVEAGIYTKDYAGAQGLFTITQDIDVCGGVIWKEAFVDAKKITLDPQSSQDIDFTVNAPSGTSKFGSNAGEWALKKNWDGYGNNYVAAVGIYLTCGGGYTDSDSRALAIIQGDDVNEKCGNGVVDLIEDCNNCKADAACKLGQVCVKKGGGILGWIFGEALDDYDCEGSSSNILYVVLLGVGMLGLFLLLMRVLKRKK